MLAWWSNARLRTRLMCGFGAVLVLAAMQTVVAYVEMRVINAQSTDITRDWLPSVEAVGELKTQVTTYRSLRFQHVLALTAADKAELAQQLDALERQMASQQARLADMLHSPEEQALFQQYVAALAKGRTLTQQVLTMSNDGEIQDASALLNGPARTLGLQMSQAIEALAALQQRGAHEASLRGDEIFARATWILMAFWAGMTTLGVWISWRLGASVVEPVQLARDALRAMAQGQLHGRLVVRRHDEVGEMLADMQQMRGQWAELVGQVRQVAQGVAVASTQIAKGNEDLSQRTESQACALQNTAASMTELAQAVQRNAETAVRANELAARATEVATQGGQSVEQVILSMQGIS